MQRCGGRILSLSQSTVRPHVWRHRCDASPPSADFIVTFAPGEQSRIGLDSPSYANYSQHNVSDYSAMSADSFLLRYLYGPAVAAKGARSIGTSATPAIVGRRALAYLSSRLAQIVRSLLTEVLEPHGLTGQHWGVMVAIVREPGTDQRRVAERQGIDANSASRYIDELEHLGLVRRVPSSVDRRSNQLELTAAGKRLRGKLLGPVIAAQDRALACLNEEEKATLVNLLSRVVETNRALAQPGVGRRKPARRAASAQSTQSA